MAFIESLNFPSKSFKNILSKKHEIKLCLTTMHFFKTVNHMTTPNYNVLFINVAITSQLPLIDTKHCTLLFFSKFSNQILLNQT